MRYSDHPEDFIPIRDRKWNDIPANENCKGYALESGISKLVMKLARHLDQEEREADGAVHWKSMGPKLGHTFQEQGGQVFF